MNLVQIPVSEILVLVGTILLLFRAEQISTALKDLFRGGPRPPSHPIPADDSRILNRRRAKAF